MSLKQGFEFKDLAYDVIRWHHIKFYNQYVLWNQYGNYYLYNIPYTIYHYPYTNSFNDILCQSKPADDMRWTEKGDLHIWIWIQDEK